MLFSFSQFGINEVVSPIHPILNPLKSNISYGFVLKGNPLIFAFKTLSETSV